MAPLSPGVPATASVSGASPRDCWSGRRPSAQRGEPGSCDPGGGKVEGGGGISPQLTPRLRKVATLGMVAWRMSQHATTGPWVGWSNMKTVKIFMRSACVGCITHTLGDDDSVHFPQTGDYKGGFVFGACQIRPVRPA
jgi:hypothetical protein